LEEKHFKAGELIITEGEVGQTFFLLSEGTAVAEKNLGGPQPQVVKEYERGQYFGERALLTNENRAASIRVTSDTCIVLSLERATFDRLLGSLNDILQRNMDEYNKYVGN
jgi:cAMP-dependent protein kinase regulator